jgi:uncharacterized protein YcbX
VRFPVKSFGGERLRRGFVGPFGLLGDRRIAVVGADGDIGTARRAHRLLAYAAHSTERESGEGAQVRAPDGRTLAWDDPELARALSADLGRPVRLVRSPASFHDAAPLHLVTDASLTAMEGWLGGEVDRRRFRPNLVVELDDPEAPFAEAGWMGRRLALGDGLTVGSSPPPSAARSRRSTPTPWSATRASWPPWRGSARTSSASTRGSSPPAGSRSATPW